MKQLERIFKALGNRRRLEIIRFLAKEEVATVSDIARHIRLSVKSTSKHLQLMIHVGILDRERAGPSVAYRIAQKPPPEFTINRARILSA